MRSRSQNVLRALIAVVVRRARRARPWLVGTAAAPSPLRSSSSALTPFVVLDPGSRLTAVLLALHGVHWLDELRRPRRAARLGARRSSSPPCC